NIGSGAYTRVVTNGTAAGGTHSLTLLGASHQRGDGASHMLKNRTPTPPNFYVRDANNTQAGSYFVFGNCLLSSDSAIFFYMRDGGTMGIFEDAGGWHGVPYAGQQWYKITLLLDWALKRVDYYVNDTLAFSGIPFRGNVSSVSTLWLYNYHFTEAWWDEIQF